MRLTGGKWIPLNKPPQLRRVGAVAILVEDCGEWRESWVVGVDAVVDRCHADIEAIEEQSLVPAAILGDFVG